MKHRLRKGAAGLVVLALGMGCAAPAARIELRPGTAAGSGTAVPSADRWIDRVDDFVRAEMQRQKVPGVAIGIVRKGEVLAAKGYGYANVEHRLPVTSETIFQSGSVGKAFTAAAVMLLVEDGKLGLDDSIARYFPDAPESWQAIQVRHLLSHTSGIPDYSEKDVDYRHDYTDDELVKVAQRMKLDFEPGSRWSYSNTGYVLLGILITKVSGRFYGDVLKDRVFAPLGMKTARIISEEDIVPNRAAGYRLVDGKLKNQEWVAPKLNTTADGSVYFTVLDLLAWDKGLRAKAVLKPESWARVFAPVHLKSGKTYPYGLGWFVDEIAGQPRHHHLGAWQGFKTYISCYLGDDLTVIVLTNLADAAPDRFVDGIAAIFDPKLAPPEPSPIPDREPAVTERVRALLVAASQGKLAPDDLPHLHAGSFPETAKHYEDLLRPSGMLQRLDLLERRELGDDRVYTYAAVLGTRTFLVKLSLAPDDQAWLFSVRPK
jgi:CubicO group peptidase (beta-lactamase class C family)